MPIEEVLIVRHGGNTYGINTHEIEHILRVQEITPVPLSSPEIYGLCSIEGSIVTVLDLSILLHSNVRIDPMHSESRLITVDIKGMRYSLLVAGVVTNVITDPSKIEIIPQEQRRKDGVYAAYKYQDKIMQILDLGALLEGIKVRTFTKQSIADRYNTQEIKATTANERTRRFLLFKMAKEQYAIEVSKIREVINVPKENTVLNDASPEVEGLITLRDELIVIIDLRKIYKLSAKKHDRNRIIIVHAEGKVVGLLIDEILDIVDFKVSDIDMLPENFKDEKVAGVAHIRNELISLVDFNLINALIEKEAHIPNDGALKETAQVDGAVHEVVTFLMDRNIFALYTHEVIEIIDNFEVTLVPDLPNMVQGVTNIRGKVVPVISLYETLALDIASQEHKKLIVCYFGISSIGLLVDTVRDVCNIEASLFEKEQESAYFSEMIMQENGEIILMPDLKALLGEHLTKVVV